MSSRKKKISKKQKTTDKSMIFIWSGGAFSPLTKAHVETTRIIATYMHEKTKKPVTVFWVPVSNTYEKESVKTDFIGQDSDFTRLDILEIGRRYLNENNQYPGFINYEISTHEIEESRPVKTYESIQMLKQIVNTKYSVVFDDSCFYIALGQDNIEQILEGKWYKPFTLLSNNLICVPRPFDYDQDYHKEFNIKCRVTEKIINSIDIPKMLEKEPTGFDVLKNLHNLHNLYNLEDFEDKSKLNLRNIFECITIIDSPVPQDIITMSSTKLRELIKQYYQSSDEITKKIIEEQIKIFTDYSYDEHYTVFDYIVEHNIYNPIITSQTDL